jgi:hypothetical protein
MNFPTILFARDVVRFGYWLTSSTSNFWTLILFIFQKSFCVVPTLERERNLYFDFCLLITGESTANVAREPARVSWQVFATNHRVTREDRREVVQHFEDPKTVSYCLTPD